MLGGFLNHTFGFRSNFLTIALFVLLSLALCLYFFKETHPQEKRAPLHARTIFSDFKKVLCSSAFWQLTIVLSLLFGGYIAFLSGSSVLFVVEFGMSKAIFPFIQASVLGGWVAGSLLLKRFLAQKGSAVVKRIGIILCLIGALELALSAWAAPQNPYLHTLGMVLYAFGANWVVGLYFPEGMELFPDIKGIAASLLTSARLFLCAVVVGVTSACYNATIYPIAIMILGTIVLMLPALYFYERRSIARSETS